MSIEWGSIIQDVLIAKYKTCQFSVGETYESLTWDESNLISKPTEEQLLLDKADYLQNKNYYNYEGLRRNAYPDIGDQLDMLWHAMDSGQISKAEDFYNALKAVKDLYPKEK